VGIRRTAGGFLMIIGCSAVTAMLLLAAIVIANYVEWDNAADALGTVAIVTLPPAAVGAVLMLLGRLVYGGWREWAPVRRVSAWLVHAVGVLLSAVLGAMFLFLIVTGAGPEDRPAVISLGVGTIVALALAFAGFWLRPRKQERPD
jgi:hypothetical protein